MRFAAKRAAEDILRANARLKAASTVTINLGSALVAAGAGRWIALSFDPFVPIWLVGGATIIWAGIYMLSGLELEHANG